MGKEKTHQYCYKEIEEYIMDGIRKEEYKEGEQLPTERELCELFHVSRMTVNKALNNLVDKGFVEKIRGSGSYVRLPNLERNTITMKSFTEQQKKKGVIVSTRLLNYSIVNAKDIAQLNIAKQLFIKKDEMLHHFVRLRYGNGQPIALQYTYVPVSRISNIDIAYLNKSFYEYIEKTLKLSLGNGESFLKICLPDEQVAKNLGITLDTPVVFVHHISCFKNGLPFEWVDTYYAWEHYTLDFYNNRGY